MKVALVTGGSRGIGFAVCRLLVEKGYEVHALYSREGEDAKRAKNALPSVRFHLANVADFSAVERVFAQLPTLDLLVNNAGIAQEKQIQDVTEADFDNLNAVNLKGAVTCCKFAAKKMIAQGGGAIVNVSSVWGQTGGSCEAVYSATKGGLIALTKALAKELASSEITVNCVAPGVIDTKMNANYTQEELKSLCEEIPLGRIGTADEVASAILFLAEHGYITGEVLSVNGGFYI